MKAGRYLSSPQLPRKSRLFTVKKVYHRGPAIQRSLVTVDLPWTGTHELLTPVVVEKTGTDIKGTKMVGGIRLRSPNCNIIRRTDGRLIVSKMNIMTIVRSPGEGSTEVGRLAQAP